MDTQTEQIHQAMESIIDIAQNLMPKTEDGEIKYGLDLIVSIARHKADVRSSQDIEKYKPK
jgi:hypothetical protein